MNSYNDYNNILIHITVYDLYYYHYMIRKSVNDQFFGRRWLANMIRTLNIKYNTVQNKTLRFFRQTSMVHRQSVRTSASGP